MPSQRSKKYLNSALQAVFISVESKFLKNVLWFVKGDFFSWNPPHFAYLHIFKACKHLMQMQHFAIILHLSKECFEANSTIQQSFSVAKIDAENSMLHSWEPFRFPQAACLFHHGDQFVMGLQAYKNVVLTLKLLWILSTIQEIINRLLCAHHPNWTNVKTSANIKKCF